MIISQLNTPSSSHVGANVANGTTESQCLTISHKNLQVLPDH